MMDWDKAQAHLKEMTEAYQNIPMRSSWFGIGVLNGLRQRFDAGERTEELYQEILDVK
jgi:hypothetical protein